MCTTFPSSDVYLSLSLSLLPLSLLLVLPHRFFTSFSPRLGLTILLQSFQGAGDKSFAAIRDRTRDLKIFSLTLSQLSYYSCVCECKMEQQHLRQTKLFSSKKVLQYVQLVKTLKGTNHVCTAVSQEHFYRSSCYVMFSFKKIVK